MTSRRVPQILTMVLPLLCLLGIEFAVFSRQSAIARAEPRASAAEIIAQPNGSYRRFITFLIPNGSTEMTAAIPDIPPGKKLIIEFGAIRAFLPGPEQRLTAGIEGLGGDFVPFVMTSQGNFRNNSGRFVAAQSMNLSFEPGGIGKGIYVSRNSTNLVANIHVYIVGHFE